ncbi:hypothetical protein QLQ12_35970 [Actinoplanes sp. NEAU-A12]|uniref:DUF4760 domain-containing protein n=1 Tax=Actinoplanes sandaracinus TaxID=3045177 RepID=A0ABT6WW83_9ACTN|nr:hypothetical protein [Actinoplanes sandaracinus]MDI6104002.1 hypothetical protein [Actinoplanes sandaracinus]
MIKGAALAKRSFYYIAIGLLAVYFILAYFVRELGAVRFEKPFLGSTLFILLLAALAHAAGLSKSQRDLERMESELKAIKDSISSLADAQSAEVAFYEGRSKVYNATVSAILAARNRVWVTHLRNEGPMRGEAADRHFRTCREWALTSDDRSFRRIILRGDSEGLKEFFRQELEFAAKVNVGDPRYLVKVLSGPVHLTEAFNVGIYDDVVFFTHRDGDQTLGISVRSRKLADEYIRHYYERLWNSPNADFIRPDLVP